MIVGEHNWINSLIDKIGMECANCRAFPTHPDVIDAPCIMQWLGVPKVEKQG